MSDNDRHELAGYGPRAAAGMGRRKASRTPMMIHIEPLDPRPPRRTYRVSEGWTGEASVGGSHGG